MALRWVYCIPHVVICSQESPRAAVCGRFESGARRSTRQSQCPRRGSNCMGVLVQDIRDSLDSLLDLESAIVVMGLGEFWSVWVCSARAG